MLTPLSLLVMSGASFDANTLFAEVEKHYRTLESFSMSIEHHDSSGLFPGDYKQTLRWEKGKRFDLVVTKASLFKPKDGQPGGVAPNYYANGFEVVSFQADGARRSDSVVPDANTMPGWEVSGGFILSWLMDTATGKLFAKPPEGMKFRFENGTAKTWRDTPIREIALKLSYEGRPDEVAASFYIGESKLTLVGFEFSAGAQHGWAHYSNQVENPKFAKKVGNPPNSNLQRL